MRMALCLVRCILLCLFLCQESHATGAPEVIGIDSLPSSESPEDTTTVTAGEINEKPVCPSQVNISMTKVQQESGDPIYCFNTTSPPCTDLDNRLNYTVVTTGYENIFAQDEDCLKLLSMDLAQNRYCIRIFATEIEMDPPQSDTFDLCVTFNEAPSFGEKAEPDIINIKLLQGTQSIQIPVSVLPDSISVFEITAVSSRLSDDFSVTDATQAVITYTKPAVIDALVNVTSVDITVNVTDDGNPQLSSQATFTVLLVNDDVTCNRLQSVIYVDTDNHTDPAALFNCQSSAGNQLKYAVNSQTDSDSSALQMSIANSGAVSISTSSQVADFDVVVDVRSVYNVQTSFNVTVSAGRKPNCTVEDSNILVKSDDLEDTIYVNFTCGTVGSNQDEISFNIPDPAEDNHFDVDSSSSYTQGKVSGFAVISLDTVYNQATFPSSVTVKVTNRYGQTTLVFPVGVDNTPPRFVDTTTQTSILETISKGQNVHTFTARDAESSDLDFSVQDASDALALIPFSIASTGTLTTSGSLNASVVSSYLLTVTATDAGGLSARRNFTVVVTDVNDPPQCNYERNVVPVTLDVTASINHVVFTLECQDFDVTESFRQLTYSIGGLSSEFRGFFGMDTNNTQQVLLLQHLSSVDITTTPSTSFTITVADQANPPLSISLNVIVTFSDTRPVCSSDSLQYSVPENSAMSSCYNLTHGCSDPTSGGLTFALSDLAADQSFYDLTNYFELSDTQSGGDNSAGSLLSYVTLCIIQDITGQPGIYKSDMGVSNSIFTTNVTVMIEVTDINDPPVIKDLPFDNTFTISETSTTQTPVATLNITDPDSGNNGLLSYTFEATDSTMQGSGDFTFKDNTKTIEVSQSLNATRQSTYQYTLTVTDGGGLLVSVNLTITVEDVNEAPQCQHPEDFTVDATAGPDYVLGNLTCWDNDIKTEYRDITYTVQPGAEPILVNVTTEGQIFLLDTIPYSYERLVYTVTVGNPAQGDSPGPSVNITVTIIYNKDFPPNCNATSMVVSFLDTDSIGCGVAKVKCSNPLQGAPTFIASQGNLTSNFDIDKEEDQSSISLRMCAKDGFKNDIGTYEVKTVVTNGLRNVTIVWKVTVTDVNEPSYFQQGSYYRELSETTAVGTSFAALFVSKGAFTDTEPKTWDGLDAIRVTDPDEFTDLYQIQRVAALGSLKWKANGTTVESNNLPIEYFDSTFSVNGTLDESVIYLFSIKVFDGENNAASVVYTINITDVNEAPTCDSSSLTFNVSLLINSGTLLDTLVCTDPDYDADKTQTVYTLGGTDKDQFQISSGGEIKTSSRLPRDKDTLMFRALVRDGANSSLEHVVDVVVNVNRTVSAICNPAIEYPPVWVINSCLWVNLTCTDPAADDTSTIAYTASGNYTAGFTLNGASGTYKLCYTRTSNGVYIFEVDVDNGLKLTTKTVKIEVIYLSSTPKFDQQSYVANVLESVTVGSTVETVTAVTEGNHTGTITYQITDYSPASASSYFHIEASTGDVKTAKDVKELIVNGIYTVTLTVQATDDFSRLKSSVSVQLTISEINLQPECQSVADQSLSIDDDVGKFVVKIDCTDANYKTELNTLTYSIQDNYFAVAADGQVSIKATLPLTSDTHALRVIASDGQLSREVPIRVRVNMFSRPELQIVGTTTTSIKLSWSFKRDDYPSIVQRYSLSFEPEGQTANTVTISKDLQMSVLANLTPGTGHQIVLNAVTIFGNFSSGLFAAETQEIPVLTKRSVRYKDKSTVWTADLRNPNSQSFKEYARGAETNLFEALKDVMGIHEVQVIGLSSGSVFVDALVAVNQTGNITDATTTFQAAVYSGKLGTTDVDAGSATVNDEKYAAVASVRLTSGDPTALREGVTVTMVCPFRLVGVGLTPQVTWSVNTKVITSTTTGKFVQTVNPLANDTFGYVASLVIRTAKPRDSGGYTCKVEAKEASISNSRSLLVTVVQKPVVDLRPLTSHVVSRSSVELNCSVLSTGDNSLEFKWYLDNSLISNPPVTQLNPRKQMLTISSALANSVYYCQVTNTGGSTNSETANIYIIRSDVNRCGTSTDNRGTEWSSAPVGQTVKMKCPDGYNGFLKRKCDSDGEWEKPDYTECTLQTLLGIQEQVETIEDGIDVTEPDIIVNSLENVTATQTLVPGDIDLSINILDRVVNVTKTKPKIKTDFVKKFVNTADNILNSDKDIWEDLDETEDKNGLTSLMKTMETIGQMASLKTDDAGTGINNESLTVISTKHIVMAYGKTNLKDIVFPQLDGDLYPLWMQQSKTGVFLSKKSYSSFLPAEGLMGHCGVYYKDIEELFSDSLGESANKINDDENTALRGKRVNSKIVSFSLNPPIEQTLSPPLLLVFEHNSGNFSAPVCSFLDFSPPNLRRGQWSSRGCEVVNSTVNLTVCQCDHLTNFAILMSPGRVTERDAQILSIISAVGCGISLLFLLLTICIYACLWRYVKSDRAIILINLCIALIIAYSLFLGGVTQTQNKDVCTAIAALLHFFFLVVFFLMLAEGVEVLVSVVYVFNTRSRLRWLLSLSWGVPLVVVGISLGVTKLEGYGNDQFCWLSLDSGLLWAFVAPALAVILANLIIVFIVLKTMFSTTAMMTKTAMEKGRAGLKALCVLLPLMGVTWVFGVFSVNEDLIVFQYLFAVFNSLQGFFIFIFHCLVSRQVQDGLKNRRRRYRAKSFKTTGTESSSQVPASKLNSSSEDDKPVNDLDRKVASPFLEADRQVQQIANKLYPNRENLMNNSDGAKSPSKVNVPVDLSDIKLQNASDIQNKFQLENGQWLTEGHVLLTEEPSIEENDAVIISSPSTKKSNGAPPSPKKTAWGEPKKSAPLHFSDYRLGEGPLKKTGQLPPLKTKPKVTLLDHYDPPPPDILADPRIQGWKDPDLEAKLQERRDRTDQIYTQQNNASARQENKGRKPNLTKKTSAQSQKSRSSSSSASHRADPVDDEQEVETIHLYEQRDLPLYRGLSDDHKPSRIKTPVDRRRRQQKYHYIEPPKKMVNSEEDLSRYGSRQPFGGIRTSADVGVPGMARPRQQRDVRWQDPNLQYW